MTALVLASGSTVRASILRQAGLSCDVVPAGIDETRVRREMADATGPEIAQALALAKALRVSQRRRDALVLGADQVLALDGEILGKPADMDEAAAQLRRLRGRAHHLVSAHVLTRDGRELWRHTETSTLWMRDFSDAFLGSYLAAEGDAILASVGCYRYEGRGAQLFERVDGDYFSILGLALVPVLAALRELGALGK